MLLGQVMRTGTPTELGRMQGPGLCDRDQSKTTYEYFVVDDLYS